MLTQVSIDDDLLEQAPRLRGKMTRVATVMEALREYIQRRQQASIALLFGKIDVDADYDHNQQRRAETMTSR